MPKPRRLQVDPRSTPYYHCISRCVRRAFLCGEDRFSGRSFDHRRQWLVDRMRFLAGIFTIDICAYAFMSNHYHLVLRLCGERAAELSDAEVVERYRHLFPDTVEEWDQRAAEDQAEIVRKWRERLSDLSWYMRCLNESIARRANLEDGCRGRFWEGRFRSQALLDEGALLTCMSYVDLNPIRAGVANSLEEAQFTSINERLLEVARGPGASEPAPSGEHSVDRGQLAGPRRAELVRFWDGGERERLLQGRWSEQCLPMRFEDYVGLLEETVRALEPDAEAERIGGQAVKTLHRFGLSAPAFADTICHYGRRFFTMVGEAHLIDAECNRRKYRRRPGRPAARRLYGDAA